MESRPPQAPDGQDLLSVLGALTDDDCRAILEALTSPMSAQEISETCAIPLSTTYRKVKMLSDAGLVEERIDLRRGSKHTKRYEPDFDRVKISLRDEGTLAIELETNRKKSGQPAGRWQGEVRQEI